MMHKLKVTKHHLTEPPMKRSQTTSARRGGGWAGRVWPTNGHGWVARRRQGRQLLIVADLLCDIAHWCDRTGVDLQSALRLATSHYMEETGGQGTQLESRS